MMMMRLHRYLSVVDVGAGGDYVILTLISLLSLFLAVLGTTHFSLSPSV